MVQPGISIFEGGVGGGILLAGNQSQFSGEWEREKLPLERAEIPSYSQFSYSQISGVIKILLERTERPLFSQFSYSQISGGRGNYY